jgi:hypothetical protein
MNISNQPLLLSLDDFTNLLKTGDWKHEQSIQVPNEDSKENQGYLYLNVNNDYDDMDIDDDIDMDEEYIVVFCGYACIESTLELEKGRSIKILYRELFSCNSDNPKTTWQTTTEVPNGGWRCFMKGIKVVDKTGNEIYPSTLYNAIETHGGNKFWEIDYTEIRP